MIKPIAIYLPQFHIIPENDQWWGKGFTEWTNVTKAKPRFKGHYQPHLPADLGFYDLRLEESRLAQEALAKEYGIHGFCYYHYWFNGKKLLHEPIERKLTNQKEDLPFMLCWANETWSRRWLGEEKEILIKQGHSFEDDVEHIKYLIPFFKDPRYIKVNDKPVFVIYRPTFMPDVSKTLQIFREECLKHGIESPYFVASNSHSNSNLLELGFDDILNFQPQLSCLPNAFKENKSVINLKRNLNFKIINSKLKIFDYKKAKVAMRKKFDYKFLPCAFIGWDNTARRGEKGIVITNQNVKDFGEDLRLDIKFLLEQNRPVEQNFVFLNAWNEWAEGNHLEPDQRFGLAFLKEVKRIFQNYE
jgi:lipopolysaccharide biosynthesis protein